MKIQKTFLIALALFISTAAQAQSASEDATAVKTDSTLTDEAELPEGMKSEELDSLLHEWHAKHLLTFDEDCEVSRENPAYTKEEYITRLSHLPNVMEMTYNEVVQKYIDLYSNRLRRSVAIMLGASNFYFPLFEEALESYQAPLELRYLPVIESALNPGATSHAGAAGLWQFMIGTGKQYGLEVTSLIDERRDPIKSSYAAAHYLKDLYGIFGDWTLVIAAYNCGPANVSKAIKRANGQTDYWTIYPYLPAETRGYVPAFIAANYIMNYYCEHNICPVNSQLPAATDTIMVSRNLRLEQVKELCNIDMDELKALNPQYRTNLIPGAARPQTLRLPPEAISLFIELGDSVYQHRAQEFAIPTEKEVTVADIPSSRKGKSSKSSKGGKSVRVKAGDTLGAIARRNHTTVEKLRRLNGLRGSNIRSGQKLRVK